MDFPTDPDITRPDDPNFTSFPKQFPEDTVYYDIYVLKQSGDLADDEQLSRLRTIQASARALARSHLSEYIWQRESFDLSIVAGGTPELYLHGQTSFGDSINDEWTVVWLLCEISKSEGTDVWIRAYDADGEFLLAEAAEKLPRWLDNPTVAKHRVWINDGALKILGPTAGWGSSEVHSGIGNSMPQNRKRKKRGRDMPTLTIHDALQLLSSLSPTDFSILYPEVSKAAFQRIVDYPSAISQIFHTATVTVPRNVACLVHKTPGVISASVEAFYLRDPVAVSNMSSVASKFPPQDLVDTRVKFNRASYAQLKSQPFEPQSPQWKALISKRLGLQNEKAAERASVGMKICTGFELLLSESQHQNSKAAIETREFLSQVKAGQQNLPTNDEISAWEINTPSKSDEDETWLHVDYAEFEQEISGKKKEPKPGEGATGAFKDKAAEETLRRMMKGFEDMMADEDDDDGGGFTSSESDGYDSESESGESDNLDATMQGEMAKKSGNDGLEHINFSPQAEGSSPSEQQKTQNLRPENRDKDISSMELGDVEDDEDDEIDEEVWREDWRPDKMTTIRDEDSDVDDSVLENGMRKLLGLPPAPTASTSFNKSASRRNLSQSDDHPQDSSKAQARKPPNSEKIAEPANKPDVAEADDSDDSDIEMIMSTLDEELAGGGLEGLDLNHLGISGDIRTNPKMRRKLAKQLLEGFKGEGGMDGTVGNGKSKGKS